MPEGGDYDQSIRDRQTSGQNRRQPSRKEKDHSVLLLTIAGLLAVVLLAWLAVRGTRPDFSQGLSYLKSRDETDVTQVASAIQEQKSRSCLIPSAAGNAAFWQPFPILSFSGTPEPRAFPTMDTCRMPRL